MSMISVTPLLRELLRQHDVSCEEEGDWLRLDRQGPRAQAWVGDVHVQPGMHSVQLDVCVGLWAGRTLVESCGGFGTTREEAVQDAMANFAAGSLHVLLSAFLRPADAQVSEVTWEVAGVRRRVTLGAMVSRGVPLPDEVSQAWADALTAGIQELPLATGTHWVRIFYAWQPHGPDTLEVLLDNEEWPELARLLRRFTWPTGLGFFSRRVFLVLQGGVDVSRALSSFIDPPNREDDVILKEILAQGSTPLEANKLLLYLPEAFGKVLAGRMGVTLPDQVHFGVDDAPDTQRASPRPSKRYVEVRLSEEPLWREALRLAEATFAGRGLGREEATALLSRSAVVRTLNMALQHGQKSVQGSTLAPLVVTLSAEAEAEFSKQTPPPPAPRQEAPPPPASPDTPAGKPWWKIW